MTFIVDSIQIGTGRTGKSETVTDNYVVADNIDTVFCDTTSNDIAITEPAAADHMDRIITLVKTDNSGNQVTYGSLALTTQYQSVKVQSDGTNWIPLL